jgi:hypothetical protein
MAREDESAGAERGKAGRFPECGCREEAGSAGAERVKAGRFPECGRREED